MDSHHCTQLPKLIVYMFAILSIKSMNENKHAETFRYPVKVDCLNIYCFWKGAHSEHWKIYKNNFLWPSQIIWFHQSFLCSLKYLTCNPIKIVLNAYSTSKTDPHFSKAVMTSSNSFYGFSNRKKQLLNFEYFKVSIIRPGRSMLLEFEKKIVLVVW